MKRYGLYERDNTQERENLNLQIVFVEDHLQTGSWGRRGEEVRAVLQP